jgi:glycosyltransferase involved in cell wall biosynthesis
LDANFVVQYYGNMGRPHCIEDLLDAAELIASDPVYHFLLIGWGVKKAWIVEEKHARRLENLTILDPFPREDSCDVQNSCDIAINTLSSGITGVSVPSRTYNVLASGKPLIAVCDENSELASVVKEEDIGWVVPPGRPDLIVSVLREAKADPDRLRSMGERGRKAAETKYTSRHVLEIYKSLIESMRSE